MPIERLDDDDIVATLQDWKSNDVRWREGRVFSLAYYLDEPTSAIADAAHRLFAGDNGLNTAAFPSLQRIQDELVGAAREWFAGDDATAGFVTSGGTESLLLAVKAARERGRAERGITSPNIVLPVSAHAAFEKACYYFGVESRRTPVDQTWRADVDALSDAIDSNTVLVVASAPSYPQGVVDPITAIAALAQRHGINCHVDACMGGITLHYMSKSGALIPPWNFTVPGVTSISVDLHKYGYAIKGCGVLMHRTKALRAYQTYATDAWLGGRYGSSGILGTKGGGPWAAAWAVLRHLGDEGLMRATAEARSNALAVAAAVSALPSLQLRAAPDTTLVAFGAHAPLDIFAVADVLSHHGWYLDRQGPPDSLHLTLHAGHTASLPAFIDDLGTAVTLASGTGTTLPYGTID